jgi:hypothetical protein
VAVAKPHLRGGEILAGSFLEEQPLYTHPPLALRVPLLSEKDTEGWSLSMFKLDSPCHEGLHFKLKDLMHLTDNQAGMAEIPLIQDKLLGRTPCGLYSLRARHMMAGEKLFKIAVLTNGVINFTREVYAPCEDISHAEAIATLPGIYDVHVNPPVELEKQARMCSASSFPWRKNPCWPG